MNPLLVTMRGPGDLDIRSLSNFEAGVAFLTLINQLAPGMTFGQFARLLDDQGTLAGWFTDMKKAVGSVKDGVGDVLRDTVNVVAGSAGSAVRLVTDEKVIDGAARLGTAYATGGGSEGVRAALGGGSAADQVIDFFSSLGSVFKTQAAAVGPNQAGMFGGNGMVWLFAGGLVLFLLTGRRR